MPDTVAKRRSSLPAVRRYLLMGFAASGMLLFVVLIWAAVTRFAGAVIAPATIVVESAVKKVQHPTGGVIAEIYVEAGDVVEAGETLLRLDATIPRTDLAIVEKLLDEQTARRARLEAEGTEAAVIDFPEELLQRATSEPRVARMLDGERRLFRSRREARIGEQKQLREGIHQLREKIDGLLAQQGAKQAQIAVIETELSGLRTLYEEGMAGISRVTALEGEIARLKGEYGRIVAAIAEQRVRIAQVKQQIIRVGQDLRVEVQESLRKVQSEIAQLVERRAAAKDKLKRINVRSPQDGVVHELAVHTVGGVVKPGDTLMLIVPHRDDLIVEAEVSPRDIDQVFTGQKSIMRLTAFNRRTTPELIGQVAQISASLKADQRTGRTYYSVRITLPPSEIERLGDDIIPGMPAEVHIQTGERTVLSYFVKPLTDQIARTFREE